MDCRVCKNKRFIISEGKSIPCYACNITKRYTGNEIDLRPDPDEEIVCINGKCSVQKRKNVEKDGIAKRMAKNIEANVGKKFKDATIPKRKK